MRIETGADLDFVRVSDSSWIEMEGGIARDVEIEDNAQFFLRGGVIDSPGTFGTIDFDPLAKLTMTGGRINGALTLDNSATHLISGGEVTEKIRVWFGADLDFVGGSIGDVVYPWTSLTSFRVTNGSTARIAGSGRTPNVSVQSGSTLDIEGGEILSRASGIGVGTRITLSDGIVREGLSSSSEAEVIVTGGVIGGPLSASTNTTIRVEGGSLSGMRLGPELAAFSGGTIEIHGADFAVDHVPVPSGLLVSPSGELTGRLANGERFEARFTEGDNIELVAAEPTYDQYLSETVTITTPTESVVAQFQSDVTITETSVRYLEVDDTASALVAATTLRGGLVAAGESQVDVDATEIRGSVIVEDEAHYTQTDGRIGFDFDLRDDAVAVFDGTHIIRDGLLSGSSEVTLRDVVFEANVIPHVFARGASKILHDAATANDRLSFWMAGASEVTLQGAATIWLVDLDDTSTLLLREGTVEWLQASGGSTIMMTGGRIESPSTINFGGGAISQPWVNIHVRGGEFDADLSLSFTASGSVSDGIVTGRIHVSGQSELDLTGGTVGGAVEAHQSGVVRINGGSIAGPLRSFDTGFLQSLIEVRGTGFAVDGVPISDGPLTAPSGRLTGTLTSGDPIDVNFEHLGANGAQGLITVPEPTSLAPALLALMFVARRRSLS